MMRRRKTGIFDALSSLLKTNQFFFVYYVINTSEAIISDVLPQQYLFFISQFFPSIVLYFILFLLIFII